MAYVGWTPDMIGRMPIDQLLWHVERLIERRRADIAALARPAPKTPAE